MKLIKIKNNRTKGLILFLAIPFFLISYLLIALIIAFIPVNKSFKEAMTGVEIYIQTNGVHSDIVVPIVSNEINWYKKLTLPRSIHNDNRYSYIAFGWGDKAFYLNTPNWSDLNPVITLKAILGMGPSALHLVYYKNPPKENESVVKLKITELQYHKLIQYIENTFQTTTTGNYELINSIDYENIEDNFYESKGRFNPFKSCNTWTNQGLNKAGIRTPVWTVFQWPIMMQLKKIRN